MVDGWLAGWYTKVKLRALGVRGLCDEIEAQWSVVVLVQKRLWSPARRGEGNILRTYSIFGTGIALQWRDDETNE